MELSDKYLFKNKALHWAAAHQVCCILDSNNYKDPYSQYDYLIAAGAKSELKTDAGNAFEQLKTYYEREKDWMFGLLGYELKNEIEHLSSSHDDKLGFPDLYFFVPTHLIALHGNEVTIIKGGQHVLQEIENIELPLLQPTKKLAIEARIPHKTYIEIIEEIKLHIKRGDIYEVNFCQEFFATNAEINPLFVYHSLNLLSPTPFSGFFKIDGRYILSATPERFLCKRQQKLISQPIKGTAKRSKDPLVDEQIKNSLASSLKEQAENVMIVDLVRNDLTKSAMPGTVKVDELFGIYSFPQVHQMISTISCTLNPAIHFVDAIKNAFPMGSMTGAPKIKAMTLIDEFERSKRGIFSGSFGCISPEGDFDFNVVIRSILYNQDTSYLSFQVGGAITYASNAEDEYNECLVKASAIIDVLGEMCPPAETLPS